MGQRLKEDNTGYEKRESRSQVGELRIQKCTDLCFFVSKLNIPLRQKETCLQRMELALYWQGYLLQSKQPATRPKLELFSLLFLQLFCFGFLSREKSIHDSLMKAVLGFFSTVSISQWLISAPRPLTGSINKIMCSFISSEGEAIKKVA